METTYKWEIGSIQSRKTFTDKFGNVRTNVIKKIELIFIGEKGNNKKSQNTYVDFSLLDLSDFIDSSELTKEQVLEWGLSKLNPKEKLFIEKLVKLMLGEEEDNFANLEIN